MKLYKEFYYLAIIVLLFFGSSIRAGFGLMGEANVYKINPCIYLLILSLIFAILTPQKFNRNFNFEALPLGVFGIIMILGKFTTHVGGYLPVVNNVLIPFLFCLLLPKRDVRFLNRCFKLLLFFFILECVWAISERIFVVNIFPSLYQLEQVDVIESDIEGFRSNALLGSPLTNSLCLTAILVFILISNIKRNYKLLLFSIGYLAILCFNTRTSIILWPVLLVVSLLYTNMKMGNRGNLLKIILIVTFLGLLFAYIILANRLGDRLFGKNLMDNSANVRVDTWNMFLSINIFDVFFSFGMKIDDIESLMRVGNVDIIENSWVLYFIELGGIGLFMILIGYYFIFSKSMKQYTRFATIFTLGSFILLGSTNNGLKEIAMSLFVICSYVMQICCNNIVNFKNPNIKR